MPTPFLFSAIDIDNKHICVIGDTMLDHYLYGSCERISPEAPVPVVDIFHEEYTLGGAGNVLKNLEAFGCARSLISVCGDDKISSIVVDQLYKINPQFHYLFKDPTRKTTIKTRVIASKHQLIRLDVEDKHSISSTIADNIILSLQSNIDKIDVVIISDYCKGVLSDKLISGVIDVCNKNNVVTIVDSKNKELSKFYGATLIKPNKKEAIAATGINIIDDITLREACEKIARVTNCRSVVVTLSEDGIAIYHDKVFTKMPTKALDVFDVTGAGDTVVASLAFGIANGLTIENACDFANHAAAIVVGKVGSAVATLEEILNLNKTVYNK